MKKAERASPDPTSFARKRAFWLSDATLPSRYMLPSSGAAVFTATGPSGDRPLKRKTCAVSSCDR